jgi:antitoxin YefM
MEETLHLLRSPKNAGLLMESIAQLEAGKAQSREMIRVERQEGRKQTRS